MKTERIIVVLDSNTILRGLSNPASASGDVIRLCDSRGVIVLFSKPVLAEYREFLADSAIRNHFPTIDTDVAVKALRRLNYVGEVCEVGSIHFEFDRDPDDAMFIELAIAGQATHIISHDKDLLSLPTSRSDAGKRFRQRLPGVRIVDAATFLRQRPQLR